MRSEVWQGVLYVQIKTETWMESEAGEVEGGGRQDKYSGLEPGGKKIQKDIMSRGMFSVNFSGGSWKERKKDCQETRIKTGKDSASLSH